MEISIDEYAAVLQSDEGKESLDAKKEEQRQSRFNQRFQSLYGSQTPANSDYREVADMNIGKFESLRTYQITQLYSAYIEKSHANMWIQPGDTRVDSVRRVVGPNARNSFNTGIMVLDSDTINTVNMLASNEFNGNEYNSKFSAYDLAKIVDEFLATRECIIDEYDLKYNELTVSKFARETDILKRSIMKNSSRSATFDIEYFKTTAQDIVKNKRSLLSKAFKFFDSKLTNKERYDDSRLGNKSQEYEL